MKAFKGNFTSPTVQDWLSKAEKDLKGKSLDALSWSWNDDINITPVYFDSPDIENFSIPAGQNPWSIGEYFVVESVSQSNKQVLEALSMGLESVHLSVPSNFQVTDWQALLDKVVLPYIKLMVSFGDRPDTSLLSLDSYLQVTDWDPGNLFLRLDHTVEVPVRFSECKQVCESFEITGNDVATSMAKQLIHAEKHLLHFKAKHIYFQVNLSKNFYQNIIFIQALKILWQNVLDGYGQDPHSELALFARTSLDQDMDENTQKIDATIQAVSAVVTGVQHLEITSSGDEASAFHRRINRNIQHLMKLESFMDQVMNPTEGVYFFDHLTKELAEAAWSKFQALV